MMTAETAFFVMLAICLGVAAWAGQRQGKAQVLGVAMACSLLSASWLEINLAGLPINVSTAVAVIGLIAYCVHSGDRFLSPITLLDALMIALVIWHVVADMVHGAPPLMTAAAAYGEWGLPYAAGRFASMHRSSLRNLSPWFAGVAIVLAAAAVFEAMTNINVWETLIATRDDRVDFARRLRYGIAYRANGPTRHCIFLGVILLTLVPWAASLLDRFQSSTDSDRNKRVAGTLALIALFLGIVATMSRGPILASVVVAVIVASMANRIVRYVALAGLCVVVAAAVIAPERVMQGLESRPDQPVESRIVVLDESEEAVIQSSARNRWLVMKIYGPLVIKGGLMGYGTEDSSGFPPRNLPGLTSDPAVLRQIGIVDNTFIGIGLRFGLVGVVLLVLLFVVAAATAQRISGDASTYFFPNSALTFWTIAAVVIGLALQLCTVYFDRDHGFWVLFLLGVVSGLSVATKTLDDV
ncbi:O-Antigen ligase [Crateriforma conspicua]|uniref:O-Antigen ligase n=1 Tax=Crateriforma conspicua TaxID=2527996 RepID=A0A5C6FYM1_9PLAN|nr:O-antigen ligase family protein [Crateriforma conspicua]TWU67424.1 O-Antigen ligase [Crateriforma conspicua]